MLSSDVGNRSCWWQVHVFKAVLECAFRFWRYFQKKNQWAHIIWVGWIPGLEIDRTFFNERFFIWKNWKWLSKSCWFWGTKILVEFPGNPILKISLNFWNCVSGTHDSTSTHAILTPIISSFWSVFDSKPYLHRHPSLVSFQMIFEALQS